MKGLFKLINDSSKRFPQKTFIRSSDHEWTYGEVEFLALSVSGFLADYGVRKGDRVVIFCNNSIQYIAAFFGIMRINAVAVPVSPVKMTENILYIVQKCSPKLVIASDSTIGKLDNIRQRLCTDIVNIDLHIQCRNSCCISGRGESRGDRENIGSRESIFGAGLPDYLVDDRDNAVILFTSGTTAFPKGVTLTHGNLMDNTEAIVEYLRLTSEDSVLMTLPFTYSYGNSVLLTHVCAGATVVIENNTTFPYKILESIKKQAVSGFSTVGSYISLMLKCFKNSGMDENYFKSLRYITFAGESTNNDDIRFICTNYPNLKVYVMYGQTEAGARLSYLDPALLPGKMGSIGKGLRNIELRVVDESGADVKPGEAGEIIARGASIMKCYWEDPVATGEVLKGGWLYTGDSAAVDEDGYIYVKGRKTDMIKHMGYRISPVEIENVINSFNYIKESAVVESILNSMSVIKAFIVLEKEWPLEDIKKYVNSRLQAYMRPQVFEIIDHLPKTDTGKIMRSSLRRS